MDRKSMLDDLPSQTEVKRGFFGLWEANYTHRGMALEMPPLRLTRRGAERAAQRFLDRAIKRTAERGF